VLRLIAELKARGSGVVLYPFVMMDVPAGNSLPNPYGAGEQAPYPWRGRITCMPAPDRPGTPDGTAAAGAEVQAFFRNPWGLRRLVLHYANLAQQAGGVEAIVIGSEFVGLTRVRSGAGDVSRNRGADAARGRCARNRRRGHEDHLCGRLDRIRRPCARRRRGGALSPRSAVGAWGHRRGRHRLLSPDQRLARRRRSRGSRRGA
jgi:hypothetical protein